MGSLPRVIAIVGPTAVGKSRLGLALAARFGGEIVSVDSRQVYRYLDIGTAKPSLDERAAIPHYMLDLAAPDEPYSVQRFRQEALQVLQRIAGRGRLAFAVGGSGFYLRALLDGLELPEVPPRPDLRARLQEEAERLGPEVLHARLARLDPLSASRIHPHNLPRVIRALEIIDSLGGPVPPLEAGRTIPALFIGLKRKRDALRLAIDRRVIQQVKSGLVEETRLLCEMGYGDARPMQGLAYRQMKDYLEGRSSLDAAIRDYQIATQQYARRQMTWFRQDKRIRWLDPQLEPDLPARLVEQWIATAS